MPEPSPVRRRAAGFTLIEVLVALAVLSVALAAALGLVGQAINTHGALRDRTLALWVAQDRLRELQLRRDWPALAARTGTSTQGGREWQWREQVRATAMPQIRRIEIEVSERDGRDTLARLAGFLREPQP
jgi:general secretion pathway protein I